MTVADVIVQELISAGVRVVFGVVGGGAMHLFDSLGRSGLGYVGCHGEGAAGYGALGYAKSSGGLGVVFVTTGCGGTNVLTPVLSAWQDGVPMLVVAGEGDSRYAGVWGVRQDSTQDGDVLSMALEVVKYGDSLEVEWNWGEGHVRSVVRRCVGTAMQARRGPCWLGVPLDVSGLRL